ncbi:MAG TPA: ATP-binding cassette domain-containing protein, partial [Spirochaetes bacterium]|nr:ATP-binding cassette domain-containing protein [Spirochaetota bacterium]
MIEIKQVSKSFKGHHALQSINLKIEKESTVVLIGPSGCGKSTLLRLIIGLSEADTGMILFEGMKVERQDFLNIRLRMGYVIQEGGLFPHLNAYDNVTLMAKYLKWDNNRIEERIHKLANLVRLPHDKLSQFPIQLSGGQRQRVSLMRALMLDPDVLLLDEPLGALDPMIRVDLQKDLKAIFQSLGKTVVIVTHDIREANYFADTI